MKVIFRCNDQYKILWRWLKLSFHNIFSLYMLDKYLNICILLIHTGTKTFHIFYLNMQAMLSSHMVFFMWNSHEVIFTQKSHHWFSPSWRECDKEIKSFIWCSLGIKLHQFWMIIKYGIFGYLFYLYDLYLCLWISTSKI